MRPTNYKKSHCPPLVIGKIEASSSLWPEMPCFQIQGRTTILSMRGPNRIRTYDPLFVRQML